MAREAAALRDRGVAEVGSEGEARARVALRGAGGRASPGRSLGPCGGTEGGRGRKSAAGPSTPEPVGPPQCAGGGAVGAGERGGAGGSGPSRCGSSPVTGP